MRDRGPRWLRLNESLSSGCNRPPPPLPTCPSVEPVVSDDGAPTVMYALMLGNGTGGGGEKITRDPAGELEKAPPLNISALN